MTGLEATVSRIMIVSVTVAVGTGVALVGVGEGQMASIRKDLKYDATISVRPKHGSIKVRRVFRLDTITGRSESIGGGRDVRPRLFMYMYYGPISNRRDGP